MCPALHEDNHKLTIVKSPVEAMDSVSKVKEKAKNIEEKSFEYEEMKNNNSDIFKERQYRSLSFFTNLVQALRILVFIFYNIVTSVKKRKRDFYKPEQILKRQSSEAMNFKILGTEENRSEFDPG